MKIYAGVIVIFFTDFCDLDSIFKVLEAERGDVLKKREEYEALQKSMREQMKELEDKRKEVLSQQIASFEVNSGKNNVFNL